MVNTTTMKGFVMQVHRTNKGGHGAVVSRAAALVFAAACVPLLSGWIIVTLLAVGIDS